MIFQISALRRTAGSEDASLAALAACSMSPVKGTASARRRTRRLSEVTFTPCFSMNFVCVGTVAQAERKTTATGTRRMGARTVRVL